MVISEENIKQMRVIGSFRYSSFTQGSQKRLYWEDDIWFKTWRRWGISPFSSLGDEHPGLWTRKHWEVRAIWQLAETTSRGWCGWSWVRRWRVEEVRSDRQGRWLCNTMLSISRTFSFIPNEVGSHWMVLNVGYIGWKYGTF